MFMMLGKSLQEFSQFILKQVPTLTPSLSSSAYLRAISLHV